MSEIESFERLPLPETVDELSDEAARKSVEWHRQNPSEASWSRRGINITPEIDLACQTKEVQAYLDRLANFVGRDVDPTELLPSFPADPVFKTAHPIAETPIFLSLTDAEVRGDGPRIAEVQTLCRGPSLGSAGGPTLMRLGAIARLTYRGLLTSVSS